MGDPPFHSAMKFCEYVEGQLGWCPPTYLGPRHNALMIEAAKVKRRIAKQPELLTWENLATTTRWLRDKHRESSPLGVCSQVQAALKATHRRTIAPPTDIAQAISVAIEHEQAQRRAGWEDWVRRLTRAQGDGRNEVYEEWQARNENSG